MQTIRYSDELKKDWDSTVKECRNATFLFERDFMDYHKDRFEDCSLCFTDDKGKWLGVLPANLNRKESCAVSHGGLTYGGLLVKKDLHIVDIRQMLQAAASFYKEQGLQSLTYKPTPHIYHKYPCEEDLYWLFRSEARLIARTASTAIDLSQPLQLSTLRKRKVKKAEQAHYQLNENEPWEAFWDILENVLTTRHQTHAVHRLDEMLRLKQAFPDVIRLHTVSNTNENCVAGCVTFDCCPTLHVQYIAASEEGKQNGALDFLFQQLITRCQGTRHRYFDFGISTENHGLWLNEGLIFQKEGFGGRTICYDTYQVDLEKMITL